MPRYELMYILSSSVSDDQIPAAAGQIAQFVSDFGGTDIQETQLGKKKLMYPIKKTRNGFYGVLDFTMDGQKINEFDAKVRTQDSTIIRYIIVNQDEHLERLARDRDVQAKMLKNRPEQPPLDAGAPQPATVAAPLNINAEELDEKIEAALTEDLTK